MSEQLVKSRKTDRYFCVFCFGDKLFDDKNKCEKHLRHHLIGSKSEESHGIDLWIERHLRYQESLSKSMSEPIKTIPDRSKTLYRGCHVCDCIIKVYDIRDEPFPSGTNIHEITIRNLNIHYSGNNVNHINPHLRYYPFECLICQNEFDKSHKRGDPEVKELMKTAVKPMMRIHVKEKHFKNSTLDRDELEEKIDKSIRTLKVTELEKLTKKENIFDRKAKPQKRKSIPGPLRETKSELKPKRLRPLVPIIVKSLDTELNYNYLPITTTQLIKLKTIPNEFILKKDNDLRLKSNEKVMEVSNVSNVLSREHFSDDESITDKSQVFGCIFCYKKLNNYEKAFEHYITHINVFLECAKCDQKFITTDKFRSHNSSHNENCNLLNLNNLKVVRKWIQTFLNSLVNDKQNLIDMTCDVTQIYCPVCSMMSTVFNINGKNELKNDESIDGHIHEHLMYFPYECIDCSYEDIKTQFCMNSSAKNHLINKHNITNANNLDKKELGTYFDDKMASISKFDFMIKQCVQITLEMRNFWRNNAKDQTLNL